MNLAIYVVGGLTLTWAAYMGYLWLSTQAIRGRPLEDSLRRHLPELERHGERALIYCYSAACGPCRSMTPLVDQLREEGYPIVKADLGQNPELAEALGVRATPTLLLVEDGQIQAAGLGAKTRRQILKLLQA